MKILPSYCLMDVQGRKNLRPTEEKVKEILAEETKKQRISRILQIRHQANELSAARRRAVEQARENEVAKLKQQLAEQWQQQHDQKLQLLQDKLDVAVYSIGQAHRAALEQKAAVEEEATRREILTQRAEDRGLKALQAERRNRELMQQQHGKQAQLRKQVKVVEQQRAERVAQRPTPPAFQPPPVRESAPEPPPVLVQEAGTLVTTQYRPSERLVTRHFPASGEDENARERAHAERCRLEQLKEQAQQQEAERLQRAAERGRAAEERQKLIETRNRLARLMSEDALHAFYRGEDISEFLNEAREGTNRNPQFHLPNHSQPLVTSHEQTDTYTRQREASTGLGSSTDGANRRDRMTSDGVSGISGMESATDMSDVDGGIGISGIESASGLGSLVNGDGLTDIEGLMSSISNGEGASGISGADPSDSKSAHTSSSGVDSDRGVSACEASDAQASCYADSNDGSPSVHVTSDHRSAPLVASQDRFSSSSSPASDFDALAALRQAEELMARVRLMKETRLAASLRRDQPTASRDAATSRYDQERGTDSSGSWGTVDPTASEDERLESNRLDIRGRKPEMPDENQRNLLAHRQLPTRSGRPLSTRQDREILSREQEMHETETSSFDEEIGVLLKFNEKSSDTEHEQNADSRVATLDENLNKSLNYIKEMKNSLGMVANRVNENVDSPPTVQIPKQVYKNLQLLKQNRRNIDNKLEAAIRSRGAEPRRRQRQRSRGEASSRAQLLRNAAAVSPESLSGDSPSLPRSNAPETQPPHGPPDIGDSTHPSKVLEPRVPRTEISLPSSSVVDSVSDARVTPGTSRNFCSVTTPVRMYREEVKQDGRGERPIRRRDKFELQKRIVLQNYIKRLLDTRRSEVLSSSVEGSGIDVSSVKVLAKLAGGSISVDSPSTSGGVTTTDKDDWSSSSSEPRHVPERKPPTSPLDRLTDEQELDRVPSRLSDIEELSRQDIGVQMPSHRSSISVKQDNRNIAVQVPSVEYTDSGTSVPGQEASISLPSRTPEMEFSSEELISVSQQPKFDSVSRSLSVETITAPTYVDKILLSNSSVTLPTFPSTSTPTVGDNVPKVSGAVSSNVSPIVGDDAISTVDQISSDQFQVVNSSDQPLRSRAGVEYQIRNRNLQKVKSSVDETQRPLDIPPEVVSTAVHSQDDVSFISDELDVVSSSLLSSDVFSELSAEELRAKKEAIEKKKAIYLRLLELNEIKQQYMILQQEQGDNTAINDQRESEKFSSDEGVLYDTSIRQQIPVDSNRQDERNNREWIKRAVSHPCHVFGAGSSVSSGEPSIENIQRAQENLHHDQHQRYRALVDELQQQLASGLRSESDEKRLNSENLTIDENSPALEHVGNSSTYYSHADRANLTASRIDGTVERSSGEWATTNGSDELEKSSSSQMGNASAFRSTPPVNSSRSRAGTFDHEATPNFTSVEISEGLISPAETGHSPLLPEFTQTSLNYNTEESLEEGLISTGNPNIVTGSIVERENDQRDESETLKDNARSWANDSFKKLLEIIDLRKLSGLSDLQQVPQRGNYQSDTSAVRDKSFQAARSTASEPSLEENTSSVRSTSDEWLEHAYDADHSSKGTTSSTRSDVDVMSERVTEQLKRIEGVLRDVSDASAAAASTTSGDTLLADLASNLPSATMGSSSPSDLEEVLRKYGWARGMLNKMNRLDQGYSSSSSSNS